MQSATPETVLGNFDDTVYGTGRLSQYGFACRSPTTAGSPLRTVNPAALVMIVDTDFPRPIGIRVLESLHFEQELIICKIQ